MFMMWSAVNRISRAGEVIGPDQRVTPMEAMKSRRSGRPSSTTSRHRGAHLKPGKLADLVILDSNPLKVEPMAIRDVKVVETIKEGKSIYRQ